MIFLSWTKSPISKILKMLHFSKGRVYFTARRTTHLFIGSCPMDRALHGILQVCVRTNQPLDLTRQSQPTHYWCVGIVGKKNIGNSFLKYF